MPKINQNTQNTPHLNRNQPDFEEEVMKKIKQGKIVMKPRWFFIAGSLLSLLSLIGLTISSIFLVNIFIFLLRSRSPWKWWRLETMLTNFPWWIALIAFGTMIAGVWLLKKYDFSYKKNFFLIAIGFIVSIIISAVLIDQLGLNEIWARRGAMRRFYQQFRLNQENNRYERPNRRNHRLEKNF